PAWASRLAVAQFFVAPSRDLAIAIGFLPLGVPVAELVEGNAVPGDGAGDVTARAQHLEIAGEEADLRLATFEQGIKRTVHNSFPCRSCAAELAAGFAEPDACGPGVPAARAVSLPSAHSISRWAPGRIPAARTSGRPLASRTSAKPRFSTWS